MYSQFILTKSIQPFSLQALWNKLSYLFLHLGFVSHTLYSNLLGCKNTSLGQQTWEAEKKQNQANGQLHE